MQDHGPVRGAAHPSVADPHHVPHALGQQLRRQRQVGDLRHPRVAARSAAAKHQDGVLVHVEGGVAEAGLEVLDAVEHHGATAMAQQVRRRGSRLDQRTVRSEVAA